jgi:predicted NBD/HSP70 family sugar kinase
LLPPPQKLIGTWSGIDIAREAASVTGYDVHVFNDGNAACFAELTATPPPRPGDFAFLLLDTFVAAGIIAEDHLWEGVTGASANLGSMLVSDRTGTPRFVHEVASLTALRKRLDAAGTTIADALGDEPSDLTQTVVADWIEDASTALAQVILNTATVIEVDFAVIEARLPAPTLQRVVEATSRKMLEFPSLVRSTPAVRVGHVGRPAAAQGAAQMRMYRRFYSRELADMEDN